MNFWWNTAYGDALYMYCGFQYQNMTGDETNIIHSNTAEWSVSSPCYAKQDDGGEHG